VTQAATSDQVEQPPVGARRRAVTVLAAVATTILAVDILIKVWAVNALTPGDAVTVIPHVLYWTLTRNPGAAFSIGTSLTWVFPLVTAIVIVWIVVMARRLRSVPWGIALGLVLGGALGNLVDRIFRAPGFMVGHVIDYISVFDAHGEHFAIFNLADSALSVGVVLAILLELRGRHRDGTVAGRSPAPVADNSQL
jgi:signal peptidase II